MIIFVKYTCDEFLNCYFLMRNGVNCHAYDFKLSKTVYMMIDNYKLYLIIPRIQALSRFTWKFKDNGVILTQIYENTLKYAKNEQNIPSKSCKNLYFGIK